MFDKKRQNKSQLVHDFNSRKLSALTSIYDLLYDELYFFTTHIYQNTIIDPADIIHDVFIKIWDRNSMHFNDIENIKAYMFVTIKNMKSNYLDRLKTEYNYRQNINIDRDSFISEVAITETIAIIAQEIDLLPEQCANVFKLSIEGWEISEIAQMLNKSESTVYNQRTQAIKTLKKRIGKNEK